MKHTLLLILFILFALSGKVFAFGIGVSGVTGRIVGDSLCIEMKLNMDDVDVTPKIGFTFTPVLRSRGKVLPLPAVVVTGKRRYRFDRREHILSPVSEYIPPYRIIFGNHADRGNDVEYRAMVPYSPWMNHASLALMQEVKDCCDLELLTIDTLVPDLGITGGVLLAETQQFPVQEVKVVSSISPVMSPCLPCTSMVSYLIPDIEIDKRRSENATLYIDYPLNRYEVQPGYKHNAVELEKLDSLLKPITGGNLATMESIRICGYASPEGPYNHNEELASNRARYFMRYMIDTYRLPQTLFNVTWVAEDWVGLIGLLKERKPAYYEESLGIIERFGVFNGREKQLMDLRGGEPYRQMLAHLFPLLRRIQVTVNYDVRQVSNAEAAELIYSHPRMLSLQEMYRVARYYRPGTEQYREIYEIAAYHFPDDAIANINAGSAVIMAGDFISAHKYLDRFKDDPRAWNDLGVLALMEGNPKQAAALFRKAMGIEPYKARKNLEITEAMLQGDTSVMERVANEQKQIAGSKEDESNRSSEKKKSEKEKKKARKGLSKAESKRLR